MPRHCLTLDLKDDPALIAAYREHHAAVWPEIRQSLTAAGIEDMEIYLLDRRLFMIMDVKEDFSFDRKAAMDAASAKVQEWETLMGRFQAEPVGGGKAWRWTLMERIFSLVEQNAKQA
jgi:L-rhamnose mutarotase